MTDKKIKCADHPAREKSFRHSVCSPFGFWGVGVYFGVYFRVSIKNQI